MYKDLLDRELVVKFSLGGFKNDITICELYRKKKYFFIFSMWVKVFSKVTTDNIDVVANWEGLEWEKFVADTIRKYNTYMVSKEKVTKLIDKKKQKVN